MKYGMTTEQYSLLEQLVIQPLKNFGAQVFIFGSRATGKHHAHSDVDLLYKFPLAKDLPPGFLSRIKENAEESRFPFVVELVNDSDLVASYRPSVTSQMKEL